MAIPVILELCPPGFFFRDTLRLLDRGNMKPGIDGTGALGIA